jgi:hypothetical protein
MNLREKIAQQFGVELNIGSGDATADAPIELLDRNPQAAVWTAVAFLDCLNSALGQIFYIAVIRWSEPPLPPGLLEVGVVIPDPANPAAEPASKMFVFDVRGVHIAATAPWPQWAVEDPSGVRMPLQIGCLHYRGRNEEGADHPGIGRSYAYGGEGKVKLTAYIYAGEKSAAAESPAQRLKREFTVAEAGVETMFRAQHWQCQKFTTHTDPDRHVPLSSGWLTSNREESAVFLGVRHDMLIKVRFTHDVSYPKLARQWLIADVNRICAASAD